MESKIESRLDKLQFRFKTKQEFEDEFGDLWWNEIGPGWDMDDGGMDEFFGKIVDEEYKLDCFKAIIGTVNRFTMYSNNGESWTFDKSMIIHEIIET